MKDVVLAPGGRLRHFGHTMPYVSLVAHPGRNYLRMVSSDAPLKAAQPLTPEGRFGDRPEIVVFQREVPDPGPVLARSREILATSQVADEDQAYDCPAPIAIRAIELATAEFWPPNRVRCPDCQHDFVAPIAESARMYVACPHCQNPILNPRWNSA